MRAELVCKRKQIENGKSFHFFTLAEAGQLVSFGGIGAKKALPSLEKNCFDRLPPTNSVEAACHWAIEKLTGERALPPKTIERIDRDWFLVPIE